SATEIRAQRPLRKDKEKRPDVTADIAAIANPVVLRTPRRRPALSPAELLRRILDSLEDGKAEDIVTIDLAGKTTIADFMVVATGRSARQVAALTDHLEQMLRGRVAVEGKSQGDWVLIEAGDVIVHIFWPEIRGY